MVDTLPYPLHRLAALGMNVDKRVGGLNLVGVRTQRNTPDAVDDLIYVVERPAPFAWLIRAFPFETEPSSAYLMHPLNPAGCAIMAAGQYVDAYQIGAHRGRPALVQVGPVSVYRDNDRNGVINFPAPDIVQAQSGLFGINIHDIRGDLAGCQGLRTEDIREFLSMVTRYTEKFGKSVTYTLLEGV